MTANLSSDDGVEHGKHGFEVCIDELVMCRWLMRTVALRLDVDALVLVSLAMPGGAQGLREHVVVASEL